jgi:hypothetical protein
LEAARGESATVPKRERIALEAILGVLAPTVQRIENKETILCSGAGESKEATTAMSAPVREGGKGAF